MPLDVSAMTLPETRDEAPLLQLSGVYKRFGTRIVLRDVSFQLASREAVAVLGANGAGKTTMLRTAATLSRPTRGSVVAFGVDAWSERSRVRSRLGVVAHQPYVYPELTCAENLRFFASMYDMRDTAGAVSRTLKRVGLTARADQRAGELSRGLLQRLNVARAILHEPAVLILDEPDTGLDTSGRAVLTEVVRAQLRRDGGAMFTTHSLDLALALATRVVVIHGGRIELDRQRDEVDTAQVAALMTESPDLARA